MKTPDKLALEYQADNLARALRELELELQLRQTRIRQLEELLALSHRTVTTTAAECRARVDELVAERLGRAVIAGHAREAERRAGQASLETWRPLQNNTLLQALDAEVKP